MCFTQDGCVMRNPGCCCFGPVRLMWLLWCCGVSNVHFLREDEWCIVVLPVVVSTIVFVLVASLRTVRLRKISPSQRSFFLATTFTKLSTGTVFFHKFCITFKLIKFQSFVLSSSEIKPI